MEKEIERKFWLADFPDLATQVPPLQIHQGYLAVEQNGQEVRIRRLDDFFTLTVKKGTGLERLENEIAITKEQFAHLWPSTVGRRIQKERFIVKLDSGYDLELDHYLEPLSGLLIGEIEFSNRKEALAFTPPTWLGIEVTGRALFANKNLLEFPSFEALQAAYKIRNE